MSIIAMLMLFGTFVFTVFGIVKSRQWFWLSALCMYIFSFLGGFSIGLFTLIFTYVFVFLAAAYLFHWIKKDRHVILVCLLAICSWLFSVVFIDDLYLFYPFKWL